MAEDFSPYVIPDSPGIWGTRPRQQHDTGNGFVSGDLYLKSIPAESPSRELDELLEFLTSATNAYLTSFKADRGIPYLMRHGFDQDMEAFSRHLSEQVANSYHNAIEKGVSVSRVIVQARVAIESEMRTLSAKLNRYDREFSTWLALESLQSQGYSRYLFFSEQGPNTCERCLSYHGQMFSLREAPQQALRRPFRATSIASVATLALLANSARPGKCGFVVSISQAGYCNNYPFL